MLAVVGVVGNGTVNRSYDGDSIRHLLVVHGGNGGVLAVAVVLWLSHLHVRPT